MSHEARSRLRVSMDGLDSIRGQHGDARQRSGCIQNATRREVNRRAVRGAGESQGRVGDGADHDAFTHALARADRLELEDRESVLLQFYSAEHCRCGAWCLAHACTCSDQQRRASAVSSRTAAPHRGLELGSRQGSVGLARPVRRGTGWGEQGTGQSAGGVPLARSRW